MSRTDTDAAEWLSNHPRMLGVLFMITLLLAQAGSAAAAAGSTINGP